MNDNLAPQGTASPLYNPNAAAGTAGSLEPTPTPYVPPSAASVSSLTSKQTPLYTGTPPTGTITLQDIQNLIANPTTTETNAQNTETNTQNTLKSLMDRLGTQGTEQANLENQAGLPGMQKTLTDLTNQINTVNAQLGQTKLDAMGRLVPMFQQTAEEHAAQRQASAQLLGLSASANAIKGNIATAQLQVAHALKAEFDPVNAQIKYWTTVLTQNRADMTAAQKQKAKTITQTLRQYDLQVKQQQSEKSAVYKIMLKAAENRADAVTLARIQSAPDEPTAIQIAGGSLQTHTAKSGMTKTYTYGGKVYSYQVDANGNPISAPTIVGSNNQQGGIAKGSLSSKSFVNKVLSAARISYPDAVAKVPKGKIGVIDNATGQVGTIDTMREFDSSKYTLL